MIPFYTQLDKFTMALKLLFVVFVNQLDPQKKLLFFIGLFIFMRCFEVPPEDIFFPSHC